MIRAMVVTISTAVLLGGCADGAANFGTTPPVALVTTRRELVVPFNAARFSDRQLRRNIDALAEGNVQAVRAHIVATTGAQANGLRQALIGTGLDPTRITESIATSRRGPNATVVLSRTAAIRNDCAAAIAPAFPDDPTPSLLSLSRCTQNNNLAAMVVDPTDLVAPPQLGHADGAYLADSVQSWRAKRLAPLPAPATSGGIEAGVAASVSSSIAQTTGPVTPSTSRTP